MALNFTDHMSLDARPDRIDFRDRAYRPPLVSLPHRFPPEPEITAFLPLYTRMKRILNQGPEGACTGFGLAAVINYVIWDRWVREAFAACPSGEDIDYAKAPKLVSPWMLYDNARMYDEWEGEDYSGSSCRGAMKGWHKHGVCDELRWDRGAPRRKDAPKRYVRPAQDWREDAGQRPLGAYFRVDIRSIADMQAAIREVRAVFCSAHVHTGWNIGADSPGPPMDGMPLPMIQPGGAPAGGHAFALMGYTPDGFIVQNSWGPEWGNMGFGLLAYEDWIENGHDAWVAALAAPMRVGTQFAAPAGKSDTAMHGAEAQTSAPQEQVDHGPATQSARPWSKEQAYAHAVVLGNDGKLLRRLVDVEDGPDHLSKVADELPKAAIAAGFKHIAVYAHGGLNSEDKAMARAMRLGPWLKANGIYPIFLVWRTSLMDSLGGIGLDFVDRFEAERAQERAKGFGDVIERSLDRLQQRFDLAFEAAAEKVIGKAVWSQMKQNAAAASVGQGGARQLSKALGRVLKDNPDVKLHLVGHSAGSLQLGHMLRDLNAPQGVDSLHLYAPACTAGFAAQHFGWALDKARLKSGRLFIDLLSVDRENADSVEPYGKSILWLVSRAFEAPRKTPILGLAMSWPSLVDHGAAEFDPGRFFHPDTLRDIAAWADIAQAGAVATSVQTAEEITTRADAAGRSIRREKATHGSFDNNISVVSASVRRMLGLEPGDALPQPILDLSDI